MTLSPSLRYWLSLVLLSLFQFPTALTTFRISLSRVRCVFTRWLLTVAGLKRLSCCSLFNDTTMRYYLSISRLAAVIFVALVSHGILVSVNLEPTFRGMNISRSIYPFSSKFSQIDNDLNHKNQNVNSRNLSTFEFCLLSIFEYFLFLFCKS